MRQWLEFLVTGAILLAITLPWLGLWGDWVGKLDDPGGVTGAVPVAESRADRDPAARLPAAVVRRSRSRPRDADLLRAVGGAAAAGVAPVVGCAARLEGGRAGRSDRGGGRAAAGGRRDLARAHGGGALVVEVLRPRRPSARRRTGRGRGRGPRGRACRRSGWSRQQPDDRRGQGRRHRAAGRAGR